MAKVRTLLPDTYYARTAHPDRPRPPAEGTIKTDVLVVGGGLAGLALARDLARAGTDVRLIEAKAVGFGASGRNGGFASPGYAVGLDEIERRAGRATADALEKLTLEALDEMRALCVANPDAGTAMTPGILYARRTPSHGGLQHEQAEMAARFGVDLTYLDRDEVRQRLKSAKYHEGLRSARSVHLHPLNYTRLLARTAEDLGARIHEGSPATSLMNGLGDWTVTTPKATITARNVVLTTGGYTGPLYPRLQRSFVPVATYVMASAPAPDLLATAIATTDAVGDERRAGDYYRLFDGGQRLLWGGAITVRDRSPDAVAAYLRRGMVATYPQLADLPIEVSWSGLMSYARHKMPQVGQVEPGLWHATAFGGHGLTATHAAARAVSEALLGQSDRVQLFAPWGLTPTFGPLGKAAAQATYWALQARDAWSEARAARG